MSLIFETSKDPLRGIYDQMYLGISMVKLELAARETLFRSYGRLRKNDTISWVLECVSMCHTQKPRWLCFNKHWKETTTHSLEDLNHNPHDDDVKENIFSKYHDGNKVKSSSLDFIGL